MPASLCDPAREKRSDVENAERLLAQIEAEHEHTERERVRVLGAAAYTPPAWVQAAYRFRNRHLRRH